MGLPPENVFVVENGYTLHFDTQGGRVGERVPGGYIFVDGSGIGDVGPAVLRDRELLSQDGFVVVNVKVDAETGKLVDQPEIISRGFIYMRESSELIQEITNLISELLKEPAAYAGRHATSEMIRDRLKHALYAQTRRRPMIVPVVVEV